MGFLGIGEGKKKEEEKAERRSQLQPKLRVGLDDPSEAVKDYLEGVAANTYKTYPLQEYGLRVWWVRSYEGEKERTDGPYFTEAEAEEKRSNFVDAEPFELRNITKKSEAKKAIDDKLKARKLEQEVLQREMARRS